MRGRIAVVQMQSELYVSDANRAKTASLIESAADDEARLVVLPELAISGYGLDEAGLRASAEPVDGPTLAAWADIARRRRIVIAGGFCELHEGRLYNAAMLVGPGGLLAHYRKLHLFDREKLVFTPGDRGLPVADTPAGRIGLCVCFDLRFVEVVRALALMGADIVAVPTAWVGGFDRNPRDAMGWIGQARGAAVQANLSQVYIACASQAGRSAEHRFLGSSLVCDPYGEALAGPLDDEAEAIVLADFDIAIARNAQIRSELVRPREDRRTDVYAVSAAGRTL